MAKGVHEQIDRLSELPDELLLVVLSLLPTRLAARTSRISRRFRHIWKECQSVLLRAPDAPSFLDLVDHSILRRDHSRPPLLCLNLELDLYHQVLPDPFYLSTLLDKAKNLGLKHLTIRGSLGDVPSLKLIFSMHNLVSLSLEITGPFFFELKSTLFPTASGLRCLTSLSLELFSVASDKLSTLFSQLPCLKFLDLAIGAVPELSLSNPTIQVFRLTVRTSFPHPERKLAHLTILLPSLLSFSLKTADTLLGQCHLSSHLQLKGRVPFLTEANIKIGAISTRDIPSVNKVLSFISQVERLELDLMDSNEEEHPYPLLGPGSVLENLKELKVKTCFHKENLAAIISLISCSPELKSLDIIHEGSRIKHNTKQTRKDTGSVLPPNNNDALSFRNLQLGDVSRRESIIGLMRCLTDSEIH